MLILSSGLARRDPQAGPVYTRRFGEGERFLIQF